MTDQKLTDILAGLVRTNASQSLPNLQQVTGLSNAILSQAGLQNPYKSNESRLREDPRGPSIVNRVLDVMSRPLYGVLTPAKKELEENIGKAREGDLLGALAGSADMLSPITHLDDIWAGVSGKEKTTGRDLIKASGLDEDIPKPAQAVAGLAIDIAADPLTYVGGIGLASKIGKGAKTSTEALRAVEEGTGRSAQTISEEISRRAAEQANNLRVGPPNTPLDFKVPESNVFKPSTELTPQNVPETGLERITRPQLPASNPAPLDEYLRTQNDLASAFPKVRQPELPANAVDDIIQNAVKTPGTSAPKLAREDNLRKVKELQDQIATTKSPVAKNILNKQVEKLQAGVRPADVITQARIAPPPFPEITINPRWVEDAKSAAASFLKNNRLSNINHVGQTNLYNKILHAASKVRKDRRAFHVFQMLRVAEDDILAAGRHLTDAEGVSVRLTDLANLMGGPRALNANMIDNFRKARPSQALEDLKAYTTPQVASEILDPAIQTAQKFRTTLDELPPSQSFVAASEISKSLTSLAKKAGASSMEAGVAKRFIDDLFSVDRDKIYGEVEQQARNLVRMVSEDKIDALTLHKISDEVYKSLGANPKILGRQLEQSKVTEGIMTKFATWWGAKDLKPFSREYIDTARNVAAAFSETMKPLVKYTTATQRKSAWPVAAGKRSAISPEEQQLADQFKYMVERLMGTHGIKENAEAVILRSGTLLKELNAELPKALRLTEGKGTDKLGRKYDYSNGNWMHSWKEWEVDEPAEALYQLTRSLQMVTRKNAMWDDAAARWGMPFKKAEYQYEAKGVERLAGTYFPEKIAQQISTLQRQLERDVFKTPHKSIELFDKVQRMWKTGVTIYSPAHHIRNLNGDLYLAALDGVVSPRPYLIATKVLHSFPTRYKSLENVFNIMDPTLRESALRARPGNVVLTTKRGEKVTAEQLYQAAESQGLFIRAMHAEDLVGDSAPAFGTFGANFKPFGGRVYDVATRASELRDHWVRLAHFADIISKSNQPLRVAIEQASRRVKKFHPDGMDLTGFEQNVLRRVIPFYSWMRKATPLVVEGALMRPHITLAFPKIMANMQLATGIESQGPGDPFPMDQMFPDWLKEKGIGPILQPGSGLGRDETWRGEAPGYTIVNPTNPFIDQVAQLGSPGKTILSSLTPGIRIPMELLQGQTSLGIPLENVEGGVPGHLAQQIPAVGIGARLTGMTRDNEPWNPEQLINWLSGMGVTGTGPYQAQSQTEIRQLLDQIAKQRRGDYR